MAAMRPIEDFFFNPTYSFIMEEDPRTSIVSEGSLKRRSTAMTADDMFSFKTGKQTPEPSATMRNFMDEPMYWRGYASDEEVASPIDADDASFHSASSYSEPATKGGEDSFEEELAPTSQGVAQLCNRAQAIQLVSAGKAKVVSMPKLVDTPTAPRVTRPVTATTAPTRPAVLRLNQVEIGSQTSSLSGRSPRTSSEKSPISTAPSSFVEPTKRTRSVRQRPSLPNLQAAMRSHPGTPNSLPAPARFSRTADFLKHDPYPSTSPDIQSSTPTSPATPLTPTRRRLHMISSSIGRNVFGKGTKPSTSPENSSGDELEAVKEPEPRSATGKPPVLTLQTPTRKPSTRPKLVARGANEREPLLVLPPCPEGYINEIDVPQWPVRQDSTTILGTVDRAARAPKLHKRQPSMSAHLVSAQA